MKGPEIKMEDVAEKIASLIVGETYISKEDLAPKINTYLKLFVKVQSIPKFHPRDMEERNVLEQKRQAWISNEKARFYAVELCKIVGEDKMEDLNRQANILNDLNPVE